jgi:hypothetical protein
MGIITQLKADCIEVCKELHPASIGINIQIWRGCVVVFYYHELVSLLPVRTEKELNNFKTRLRRVIGKFLKEQGISKSKRQKQTAELLVFAQEGQGDGVGKYLHIVAYLPKEDKYAQDGVF